MNGRERVDPIVWVVQEGDQDYSQASKFGEVRFVTKSEYRAVSSSSNNDVVLNDINNFLKEYNQELDFIMPTGNPVTLVILAKHLPPGSNQILKWNNRYNDYTLFIID